MLVSNDTVLKAFFLFLQRKDDRFDVRSTMLQTGTTSTSNIYLHEHQIDLMVVTLIIIMTIVNSNMLSGCKVF